MRRFDQVELPISHLPIGCRDRSQIIDHHVLSRLMATRWKSLEETGDPCSAAAVSEETFEQVLTSKLDALNYSGSIWLQRDQKVGWTKRRHGRLSSSGAYLGYLHYSIEWPRHARHSIHADRLLDEISSPHQNTTGFWMFLNYTIIILDNDM